MFAMIAWLPLAAAAGTASITPDTSVSATIGTWTVSYVAGPGGIAEGGAIRVQLPDAMHGGVRNSAVWLQATDPKAPNFVSAHVSRAGVTVRVEVEHEGESELVKHPKPSLDGRFERYVHVVRVTLEQGSIQEGDTVSVVYGDTTQGSPGYLAGDVVIGPEPVLLAVDAAGSGEFSLLSSPPMLSLKAGPVSEMLVHVPSRAGVGDEIPVLIALFDRVANAAPADRPVRLRVVAGEAEAPDAVTAPPGQGYVQVGIVPKRAGILRLEAVLEGTELRAVSNPLEVSENRPETLLLWGDLHSHSNYSWDGLGDTAFTYARYLSGLDFFSRTDHSIEPTPDGTRGLHAGVWEAYLAESEAHHAPPAFVTLHGYECSFGAPYGHHNVYFRDQPGPLLYPSTTTLPELFKALKAGDALTIPHHTGKFPRPVDLTIHDPDVRRNFEIYSGHGLSEAHDPDHPLAFEHSDFTAPSVSQEGPSYAQDAWQLGLHLSTVAASDDHRAKPGQPHYGITAVYAPENSREAVFQALYARRTYGTSGAKIILDFTLDGQAMGSVSAVSAAPVAKVHVAGTDTLAWVELLGWRPGEDHFQVLQRWTPESDAFDAELEVGEHVAGAIYYVRLRQAHTIRGRAVYAWSSPIWTVP